MTTREVSGAERRSLCRNGATRESGPMDDAPPRARGLLLDIGGVILRNARELIRARVSREGDAVGAYVAEHDVAGPDDAQWSAMLRHEITERQYWADRAREIGAVLGHGGWTT